MEDEVKVGIQLTKKEHKEIVAAIQRLFHGVCDRDMCFMCYCVYIGCNLTAHYQRKFVGEVWISKTYTDVGNMIRRLAERGFMYSYGSSYYLSNIGVYSRYDILLLYYMMTEQRGWYRLISKGCEPCKAAAFMCRIFERLHLGKDYKDREYYEQASEVEYVGDRYALIATGRLVWPLLIAAMPTHHIPRLLGDLVDNVQLSDNLSCVPLLELIAAEATPNEQQAADEIMAYAKYCLYGIAAQISNKPETYWGYCLQGIMAANRGDYDGGAEAFAKGFKRYNKLFEVKNQYNNVFASYYSIICFARSSRQTDNNRVETSYKKTTMSCPSYLLPCRLLTEYYLNSESLTLEQKHCCDIVGKGVEPSVALMVKYIIDYLGNTPKNLSKLAQVGIELPNHKLLRHEMSSMLKLTETEIAQLNQLYGENPVLRAEAHKETWEVELNNVLSLAGKDILDDRVSLEQDQRIVYLKEYSGIALYCQRRLKSGAWSAPRLIKSKSLFDTLFESSDNEYDKKVRSILSGCTYFSGFRLDVVLPLLIGCDRVFVDLGNRLAPVTVDEEKPYILLDKTADGKFKFISNLSPGDMKYNTLMVKILEKSRTHYTVIRYTARQQTVFNSLLSIGEMPAKAEPVLRNFMENISKSVGVHSSGVDGVDTLKSVDGDPEILIRVYPASGLTFTLDITAMPIKGCRETFAPGKGDAIIVDEINGERCRVKRKLLQEKELYDNIKQVIAEITDGAPSADGLRGEQMLELLEYVADKPKYGVEWPRGSELKLSVAEDKDWSVNLSKAGRWFEVEGEVKLNMQKVLSMAQLLEAIANSEGRYVRLSDSEFLLISDQLRRQLDRLSALSVVERGTVKVSPLLAAVGDEIFNGDGFVKVDDAWNKLRNKVVDSYSKNPRVPMALQAKLRDYQMDGYQWLRRLTDWGGGACLADDMGLGKTVQAIAYMLSEARKGAALVVAPASVLPNWRSELERFAPSLNVRVLNSAADRKAEIEAAGAGDVALTTYGLLISEEEALVAKQWNIVCLDEAHAIKNRDTKMSKVAMQLNARNRLAMTGTPIQNHLGELWNLFQFLNPGLLGTHEQFHKKFIVPIEADGSRNLQRQLKRILSPFMLRRTKREVAEELPDKTEIKLTVDLSEEETAVYETLRARAAKQLEQSNRVDVNVLTQITQLRRAACTPQLVSPDFTGESSKLNAFTTLIEEICEGDNKVLVFSQFTSFLKLAKDALDAAGYKYLYFDGSTTIAQREKIVEQFRNDDSKIFLISLKAGGLGLNLTEANYVIHLDPWWNPAIEQQATDRAYRIGQKQKVTVYHLISAHTIEEKILRLHATKRDLADQLLEGNSLSHKLTAADLLAILAPTAITAK